MPKLRLVLPLALAFVCLDQICSMRWHAEGGNYLFQIGAPLLALAVCGWRARQTAGRVRWLWLLLIAGLASWTCGMVLSGWEDHMQHVPFEVASISDFAYFFYGVPILFAFSTPEDGLRIPLFRWLDGLQAVFAGYLAYVTIFNQVPFSTEHFAPDSTPLLVLTYNVENAVLAVSCLIRLWVARKGSGEWRFYRALSVLLVSYGIGVGIYNHLAVLTDGRTTANLLVDGPYVLFTVLVLRIPAGGRDLLAQSSGGETKSKSTLVLFLDMLSPILFTLALLALGVAVLYQHPRLGLGAIGLALAVYGTRTTILQVEYRKAQLELQTARDRLEEISLLDPLTGIANRRRFDQALEAEWGRAMRTGDPLALMMIDLDYFKQVNDAQGHPQGDRCLVEVAGALRSVVARSGDLVARYGGEEFAVILPTTTAAGAAELAVQMQAAVAALELVNETEMGRFVTISVGIAQYLYPEVGSPAMLVELADQALYRAKSEGRNRVELAPRLSAAESG